MAERKGLFTKGQENKLAELADENIKLKGVLEKIDGVVLKQSIKLLDNIVFDKLPKEAKEAITPFVDEILDNI